MANDNHKPITKNDLDRFEKRIRFEQRVMDKLENIEKVLAGGDEKFKDLYIRLEKVRKEAHETKVRSAYISGAIATLLMGGKELLKKMFF